MRRLLLIGPCVLLVPAVAIGVVFLQMYAWSRMADKSILPQPQPQQAESQLEVPDVPSPITKENFQRIRNGMSEAEVVDILGPPGDYTTVAMLKSGIAYCGPEKLNQKEWQANKGKITIEFLENAVVFKFFEVPEPARRATLRSIR